MTEAQGEGARGRECGSGVRKRKGSLPTGVAAAWCDSPVCHQHLDSEVGQKNQEGAGCVVFEGGECREPVLEAEGWMETGYGYRPWLGRYQPQARGGRPPASLSPTLSSRRYPHYLPK